MPVVDIDVSHIGRKTTQAFPGTHAPEGWVKKEDRQREGTCQALVRTSI